MTTRHLRRIAVIGLAVGVVLGGAGIGTALSLLAIAPVLLLPLPLLGGVGWWYARRRQGAGGMAVTFAVTLALAQWPFAEWAVRRLPKGGLPDSAFATILMVFAGLALAPAVIGWIQRQAASETE